MRSARLRACAQCGVFYSRPGKAQAKYCSRTCAGLGKRIALGRAANGREMVTVNCRNCGETKTRYRSGRDSGKFCSRACAFAHNVGSNHSKALSETQKAIRTEIKALRSLRSNHLAYTRRLEQAKRRHAKRIASCRWCSASYFRKELYQSFCSPACKRNKEEFTASNKKPSPSERRHKRIEKGIRRARMKGVAYEAIDPLQVFDRDSWKCQRCGCKTPPSFRGSYDRREPELDHVVPLALGGAHVWANVQLLCRNCNAAKGWRAAA
jgi:5-methylcytosine-specific restriction endonuclease McrA